MADSQYIEDTSSEGLRRSLLFSNEAMSDDHPGQRDDHEVRSDRKADAPSKAEVRSRSSRSINCGKENRDESVSQN